MSVTLPQFPASSTCIHAFNTVPLFPAANVLWVNYKTKWGPEEHSSEFSPLDCSSLMRKQSDLETNGSELCVWWQNYLSLPLKAHRHFSRVEGFADLHPQSQICTSKCYQGIWHFFENKQVLQKTFYPSFLCEMVLFRVFSPTLERASAGHWFTGRSDTINLQSNWHNQRLHKSYQHSQAPRRLLRWQLHGSPPECYLPISREWQILESRHSTLSPW